jgi:hypothetical protein
MRIACWIPKATNTHSECGIRVTFSLQQWLHESASMLRYTYIDCLFEYPTLVVHKVTNGTSFDKLQHRIKYVPFPRIKECFNAVKPTKSHVYSRFYLILLITNMFRSLVRSLSGTHFVRRQFLVLLRKFQ